MVETASQNGQQIEVCSKTLRLGDAVLIRRRTAVVVDRGLLSRSNQRKSDVNELMWMNQDNGADENRSWYIGR